MNKSLITNLIAIALIIIGYCSPVFALELKTMGLYSFSGAITNWLAIHMLFEKIRFLYGSGIVTERFEEFKGGIRNLILVQFFTEENLNKFMAEYSGGSGINSDGIVDAMDFEKIFIKLKQAIVESSFGGMLAMVGGEKALDPLKPAFEIKMKEGIKEMLADESFSSKLSGGAAPNLSESVKEIVNARLEELTPQMVKAIIQEMIREHLGWLVVWGGVFGAIIGLITTLI